MYKSLFVISFVIGAVVFSVISLLTGVYFDLYWIASCSLIVSSIITVSVFCAAQLTSLLF